MSTNGRRPPRSRVGNLHALPRRRGHLEYGQWRLAGSQRTRLVRSNDDPVASRVQTPTLGRTFDESQQVHPLRYQSGVPRPRRKPKRAMHGPEKDRYGSRIRPHHDQHRVQDKVFLGDMFLLPAFHRGVFPNSHPAYRFNQRRRGRREGVPIPRLPTGYADPDQSHHPRTGVERPQVRPAVHRKNRRR